MLSTLLSYTLWLITVSGIKFVLTNALKSLSRCLQKEPLMIFLTLLQFTCHITVTECYFQKNTWFLTFLQSWLPLEGHWDFSQVSLSFNVDLKSCMNPWVTLESWQSFARKSVPKNQMREKWHENEKKTFRFMCICLLLEQLVKVHPEN